MELSVYGGYGYRREDLFYPETDACIRCQSAVGHGALVVPPLGNKNRFENISPHLPTPSRFIIYKVFTPLKYKHFKSEITFQITFLFYKKKQSESLYWQIIGFTKKLF